MKTRLLIIDDHPTQVEGYKSILKYNDSGYDIGFTTAGDCQKAYEIITHPGHVRAFDIVFLDWSLPPYPQQQLYNGEDLGKLIRKYLPNTRIILLTSHCEAFLLYSIMRSCCPEALMVKSDFTAQELLAAFEEVMQGRTYQTVTVRENLKKVASKPDHLDNFNRQIISLLSQGVKTKNIPEYISLSQSAVEKRKATIKDYFGIDKGGDEEIVREAKRRGYI